MMEMTVRLNGYRSVTRRIEARIGLRMMAAFPRSAYRQG
jgi:hypothetical protein